eukprot:306035-Prorocentrum_minimum.AAC.3
MGGKSIGYPAKFLVDSLLSGRHGGFTGDRRGREAGQASHLGGRAFAHPRLRGANDFHKLYTGACASKVMQTTVGGAENVRRELILLAEGTGGYLETTDNGEVWMSYSHVPARMSSSLKEQAARSDSIGCRMLTVSAVVYVFPNRPRTTLIARSAEAAVAAVLRRGWNVFYRGVRLAFGGFLLASVALVAMAVVAVMIMILLAQSVSPPSLYQLRRST